MKEWPEYNESGDLPIGIHRAALAEVINHFGMLNEMAKNGGLWR
jgi:hypothetical protein